MKLLVLLIFALLTAAAQTSGGRLSGTVTDATGAPIPGAAVAATNQGTGTVTAVTSSNQGSYVLYPLPAGVYTITAEAPGFRKEVFENLTVEVAAVLLRDFQLQVGTQQQQVVVSAESSVLLTESSSVESTVTRQQIEAIPLNGRDFNTLVLLSAGAVENAVPGRDFGPVAANGNRAFSNEYRLDGAPNNDVFFGRAAANVSVDAIQEFKVTSGVASAEFGRAGTQVTMITRSGTNQFHGSAFEFHRGNLLEARNPFNTVGIQPFRRDQFGGSLGGPIRRNKIFFFGNYEGNRLKQNVTRLATVPLEEFWNGDFSSLLARNIQLRDPLAPGRPVIPGNRLDQYLGGQRISPLSLELRAYYANPNRPGLANNLLQFPESFNDSDQFTSRVDYMLPRNQVLSFRYTQQKGDTFNPSILGTGNGTRNPLSNYNGTIAWTATPRASMVNELRVAYAESTGDLIYDAGGLPTAESLGLIGFDPPDPVRSPLPRMIFAGNDAFTTLNFGAISTFGQASTSTVTKNWTVTESLTLIAGRQTMKMGFEWNRLNIPSIVQPGAGGVLNFRSGPTTSTGYSFADFLMGLPASAVQNPAMARLQLRQRDLNAYFQDDWRVSSRLTLQLGVRYELLLNPYEALNRLALFDPATGAIVVASDNGRLPEDQYSPVIVSRLRDANGVWRIPLISDKDAGFNPRRLTKTHYDYLAPRVGLVFRLNERTLIRTGYGTFYTRYPYQYFFQTLAVNPPFSGTFTYNQTITNGVPSVTIRDPYSARSAANISPGGLQQDFRLPDNQQWNFTLERNLGWETVLSLGYVGNKGTHLFRSVNANGPIVDQATGQIVRRFASTFGNVAINMRVTDANSIYHAMQAEFRRRARQGVLFQANWTWAKGIDNVGLGVNQPALDVENLGRDRADSDYVRRHLVKVNAAWELPFGRGKVFFGNATGWTNRIIGGWKLAGVWQYSTGARFTPTFTQVGGLGANRPDAVYGVQGNLPRSQRTASRWFNPAAFAEVPAVDPVTGRPRFGNLGRNTLVGPGLNVADANLAKSFPIVKEQYRLTFRLEGFNIFNTPNFDLPDPNISNVNTVATINQTLRPMRQVQFAVRFDF